MLSRAHEDPTVTPRDISDKRTRALHPDAPSSLAPFASTSWPLSVASPSSAATSTMSLAQRLPSFFSQCCLDIARPDPTAVPICLPVPTISGTTRSQILISLVTGLDPRSLKFSNNDDEFYLFMELRAEYKWVTYNMSALNWVEAASIFNTTVEKKKGAGTIRKTPCALMEKLEDVEKKIHFRLKNNDFKCKQNFLFRL